MLGEFTALNMKICGRSNVKTHREIKGSDKYVNLDISLYFDSLDMMRIASSDSKVDLGRSRKGLITSMGLKARTIPNKLKKTRYAIGLSVRRNFQRLLGILKNFL